MVMMDVHSQPKEHAARREKATHWPWVVAIRHAVGRALARVFMLISRERAKDHGADAGEGNEANRRGGVQQPSRASERGSLRPSVRQRRHIVHSSLREGEKQKSTA